MPEANTYPRLTVLSCPSAVSKKLAVIVGTLEDAPEHSPRLFVNEKEVPVKSGKWLVSVPLKDGVNPVTITATNATGKTAVAYREIVCGAVPPRFEIDPYPALTGKDSVIIRGAVIPISGALGMPDVAADGVALEVDGQGRWSFTFKLKNGENILRLTAKSGLYSESLLELPIIKETGAPELVFTVLPETCSTLTPDIEGTLLPFGAGKKLRLAAQDKDALLWEDGGFSLRLRIKPNNAPTVFTVYQNGEDFTLKKHISYEAPPPENVIEKCEPGTKAGTYRISGTATDSRGTVSSIVFNGKDLRHESGAWVAFLPVAPGFNPFEVTAVNSAGKSRVIRGSVFAEHSPPVIQFTECPKSVKASGVTVRGIVADPDAKTPPAVFVNDYPAKLNHSGEWKMELDITQGMNPVTVFAKSATGKTARLEAQIECTLAVPVLKVLNCPKATADANLTLMGFARGEFEGNARPVTVTVNGKRAHFSAGKWSFATTLSPGENTFEIIAENDDGVQTKATRTVLFGPQGPRVK